MSTPNDSEGLKQGRDASFDVNQALAEAMYLIHRSQLQRQMMYMDIEVANVLSDEEYAKMDEFKQACLSELGALSPADFPPRLLLAGIEKGFTLGYWLASQRSDKTA